MAEVFYFIQQWNLPIKRIHPNVLDVMERDYMGPGKILDSDINVMVSFKVYKSYKSCFLGILIYRITSRKQSMKYSEKPQENKKEVISMLIEMWTDFA
jgi:hypothetical protein